MAQVWMSNTNTYNAIAMSVSTMGYGANTRSRLFKLSVDGNTKFDIDVNGNITANVITVNTIIAQSSANSLSSNTIIANSVITNSITSNSITSGSFIKTSGTSSQFLKADGSIDSTTYMNSANFTVTYGANDGNTNYVYPPSGFTMSNLMGFIPSVRTFYYSGTVNGDDSSYCYYSVDASYITVTCYTSEQRATPTFNWLAIWRK